jgi:hypothetical protein
MSEARELHCYQYVTVPYDKVRDALSHDAAGIFERATTSATSRASEIVATLWASSGGMEIGRDVKIAVGDIDEKKSALGDRTTTLALAWSTASAPGLFPSMEATLSVYSLSSKETQIDFHGHYQPPLGLVGNAIDAVVGHRVAEASVLRFVQEVAARINSELGT